MFETGFTTIRGWIGAALAVTFAALLASGCNEGLGTNKYANLPARFSCSYVSSMTPLHTAVNNPGMWCTVRVDKSGKRYQFDGSGGQTSYWNITASQSDKAHQWVAGLIVGLPSIPEPGSLQSVVTCYDLVCPTCYRKPVDRQLEVNSFGHASCGLCKCKYDLNNQGVIISGDSAAEQRLFRYRVTYMATSNSLLVSN